VLHPSQFQVNEAWVAFQLNEAPVHAGEDGDFNLIALMDAASCFLLSNALVPASAAEPSKLEARSLLKKGRAHKKELPRTLFISSDQPANLLATEAERQGITVVRVPEVELLLFTAEAREGFKEFNARGNS
jgi:hypothetical protein